MLPGVRIKLNKEHWGCNGAINDWETVSTRRKNGAGRPDCQDNKCKKHIQGTRSESAGRDAKRHLTVLSHPRTMREGWEAQTQVRDKGKHECID
jgi:hypothetical protein